MQTLMTTVYRYSDLTRSELILSSCCAHRYPWHTHIHHWIIGLVCSGSVILSTRKKIQTLRKGDFFVVPPNVIHALDVESGTTLAVLSVERPESLMPVKSWNDTHANALFFAGLQLSDVNKLHAFALRYLDHVEPEPTNVTPMSIEAVIKRIKEHPEESHPLDEIAAMAGYSRWHFLRLFQKETGLTPHAFVIVCRLRLLRSLLRTNTSTSAVAVSVGFSDQSHMQRIFKLHHGLTPKQFRRASINVEQ